MNISFDNKTVLVSGSTKGIGYAIAKVLAMNGANIYINGRTEESVYNAINSLKKHTNSLILPMIADLSAIEGINEIKKHINEVDILVNNFAIYEEVDFFHSSLDIWNKHLWCNLISGMLLSQHFLPKMLKKNKGRIVFISSESARNIPVNMIHYGVSKAAILALSRGLAKLAVGSNVSVNSILPGPTLSEGFNNFFENQIIKEKKNIKEISDVFIKEQRATSILQRATSTEEIANIVAFICSDFSSATTGAAIKAEGGIIDDII